MTEASQGLVTVMSTERRKQPRQRVLRRARIVYGGGHNVVPCTLLDLSSDGARIKLGDWLGIPERFELRIENGPCRLANIRYRAIDAAGVRFDAETI